MRQAQDFGGAPGACQRKRTSVEWASMLDPLPDPMPVRPRGPMGARVRPPGSRSLTNRALVTAALAEGESALLGATESDDALAMREGLRALGVPIAVSGDTWTVSGCAGRLPA